MLGVIAKEKRIWGARMQNAWRERMESLRLFLRAETNWAPVVYHAYEQGWTIDEIADATGEDPAKVTDWLRYVLKPIPSKKQDKRRIYFIADSQRSMIKIGIARDPDARFRDLQNSSPIALALLGSMPGDRTHEAELHQRFSDFRLHGEWFKFAPEILAYLATLQLTGAEVANE